VAKSQKRAGFSPGQIKRQWTMKNLFTNAHHSFPAVLALFFLEASTFSQRFIIAVGVQRLGKNRIDLFQAHNSVAIGWSSPD
jgi:hypothetical protein